MRGVCNAQIAYEISKSYDFKQDFGISAKISRFQTRFQGFSGISMRFQDFKWDFKILSVILGFQNYWVVDTAKFVSVAGKPRPSINWGCGLRIPANGR